MKTANDRAYEFLEDNPEITLNDIVLLLKEQDKLTRHACAEDILIKSKETNYIIEAGETGEETPAILTDHARRVCMNVKAV